MTKALTPAQKAAKKTTKTPAPARAPRVTRAAAPAQPAVMADDAQEDPVLRAQAAASDALGAFADEPMPDNDRTMHSGLHDGHDAAQHFEGEVHDADEWPENWAPPNALDAPEARAGMVQRWVRLSMRGESDANNVKAQTRTGWRPRTLESVPEGDRSHYPTMKDPRSTGSFIINKDLVLCEMPKRLFDQMAAFYAKKRKDQVDALVDQPLAGSAIAGADRHGFGAPHVEHRSTRVSTRVPIVAAD